VAFEDVFKKSIINGSLDDVRNLGFALKKQGHKANKRLKNYKVKRLNT